MKLYADSPTRRLRQMVGDALLLGWILIWIEIGKAVHDATMALARPGQEINEASSGLADKLREASSVVGDTPLVGDELQSPFDGAGDAADQIASAGTSSVEAVEQLAHWLGWSVGAIPVLILLVGYLPLRWRFVRAASAGQRFVNAAEDLDLFALRALARQPMHRLGRISDDPAGAWRRGDPDVVRALAVLELNDVGLTPPPVRTPA
jgi:hypothetical protein